MELWLLGAGALVLIAVALWIVWPARSAEGVGATAQHQEVTHTAMTEGVEPKMPPQGDRFEDQYTSVTADLSAGGVAAAMQSMQGDDPLPATPSPGAGPTRSGAGFSESAPVTPYPSGAPSTPGEPVASSHGERWPEAPVAGERIGQPSRSENFPYEVSQSASRSFVQPRTVGLGAGAVVSILGAVGGAWLYVRWQRERNKPLNRLRRGARDVAGRLGERMPDVDQLPPKAAPMGGAASALLLASLLAARSRRQGSDDRAKTPFAAGTDVVATAKERARRIPFNRLPSVDQPRPAVLGLGLGGLAAVAGGSYVVWRLLRNQEQQNWYGSEDRPD